MRKFCAFPIMALALMALALTPTSGEATPIQAVYQFSAQDFVDSNNNPPPPPTSNAVAGTFTFTFDDAALPQHEIVPDAVVGVDLTYFDGTMMDFDETNSGVDVDFGNVGGESRITFGGTVNAVCCMIGLTSDFRLRFDISLADGTVSSVVDHFSFNSHTDPFYVGPTTMTLVAYQVVPEPSASLLFGMGLAALSGALRLRRLPGRERRPPSLRPTRSWDRPIVRGIRHTSPRCALQHHREVGGALRRWLCQDFARSAKLTNRLQNSEGHSQQLIDA